MKFARLLVVLTFLFPALLFARDNIPKSIYSFKLPAHRGGIVDFAEFKGKKILIVNVPSMANMASQYKVLEEVSKLFKDRIVVVGILTDDFQKPPLSKKAQKDTSAKEYNVTFPLVAKLPVRGDSCAAIFQWLNQKKYNKLQNSEIHWDFQKYIIDEKGHLAAVFLSKVYANSREVEQALLK